MYIGDINIPYVSELSVDRSSKEKRETNFISGDANIDETAPKLKELTLAGVMAEYGNKTADDYVSDFEAALIRSSAYNIINYDNTKGYLVLTDIDIPNTAENYGAREFSASGNFLPASHYECAYRVETDYVENDLGLQFPPIVALPTGARNVRIKSPWEIMFVNKWYETVGSEGSISIFKPFPIFDADNYTDTTGARTFSEPDYGCFNVVIDTIDEYVEWETTVGTDMPKGRYKIVFRIKDTNITDDINITVVGAINGEIINETFTTGTTSWTNIETSEFEVVTHDTYTVTIKKLTSATNTISVNYGFILPTYVAKVVFENDTEVDCGNVKVYDSDGVNNGKQVFNYNHVFSTGITVQNSFFRWHIDPTKIWDETGELTNLINNQVGRLYPRAFKNNGVNYIVKEIRPDLVEIEFYLFDGESDADATDCREIVLARFTPLYVTFELIRNGSFKWDWHIDFSTMPSWKAIYAPTGLITTSSLSDISHKSDNNIFTVIFDECIAGICKSKSSEALLLGNGGMYVNDTTESGNFMFTLFMISGYKGSSYIYQNAPDAPIQRYVRSRSVYDDFSYNSSTEYLTEHGSSFTKTYAYSSGKGLRITSDSDSLVTMKLNNLKLGTGTYKGLVTVNANKSITREIGMIIAGDPDYNDTYYVCCIEFDASQSGGGNNSKLKLLKFKHDTGSQGTYGVDGYGMYAYGADGSEVIAASKTITAYVGSSYYIECEYDNENRSFNIYFYPKDDPKPSTSQITYIGDETFKYGNVGLFTRVSQSGSGNIDVVFNSLEVKDSLIYENTGFPFVVITGTSHGGTTGSQYIHFFDGIIGEDIEIGRYILAVQSISTDITCRFNFTFKNSTKNTTLAIDTTASQEDIGGYSTLTLRKHIVEFKKEDIGDNAVIRISKSISGYYPINIITFAALIPITNIEGSEVVTPTNLSFASFNEQNYYRNIEPREFGSNLLNRKYKAYR